MSKSLILRGSRAPVIPGVRPQQGMTQREIQGHLEEIYGMEISPSLIPTVTDAVLDEVRAWQSRPLEGVVDV